MVVNSRGPSSGVVGLGVEVSRMAPRGVWSFIRPCLIVFAVIYHRRVWRRSSPVSFRVLVCVLSGVWSADLWRRTSALMWSRFVCVVVSRKVSGPSRSALRVSH